MVFTLLYTQSFSTIPALHCFIKALLLKVVGWGHERVEISKGIPVGVQCSNVSRSLVSAIGLPGRKEIKRNPCENPFQIGMFSLQIADLNILMPSKPVTKNGGKLGTSQACIASNLAMIKTYQNWCGSVRGWMAPGGQPQSIMEIMARTWFIARLGAKNVVQKEELFVDSWGIWWFFLSDIRNPSFWCWDALPLWLFFCQAEILTERMPCKWDLR